MDFMKYCLELSQDKRYESKRTPGIQAAGQHAVRAGDQYPNSSVGGSDQAEVKTFLANSTWGKIKNWILNSKEQRAQKRFGATRECFKKAHALYGREV